MKKPLATTSVVVSFFLACSLVVASAQSFGRDNADGYATGSGNSAWLYGGATNGGFGFTPWVFKTSGPANHGFYVGNGGNIATTNNGAWSLFANDGGVGASTNVAVAFRGFSNALPVNGVFKIKWLNRGTGTNTWNFSGLSLRTTNANSFASNYNTGERFALLYRTNALVVRDSAGERALVPSVSLAALSNGVTVEVVLSSSNVCRFRIKDAAETNTLGTYTNISLAGSGALQSVALYGSQTAGDQSFNSMEMPWDTDGDGIPDGWEIIYGFNPNNPADAGLDADADGLTNLEEYSLGTNPRLAVSLALTITNMLNGNARLQWPTQFGGMALQQTLDFFAWQTVAGPISSSSFTVSLASGPSRFYRLISTSAVPVFSANVVGYVNRSVPAGTNYIADSLLYLSNVLNEVLPSPPNPTDLFKVGPSGLICAFYDTDFANEWIDCDGTMPLKLRPGEGAIIETRSPSSLVFVGEVLQGNLTNKLPAGLSLCSSIIPRAGYISSTLGFPAEQGDGFISSIRTLIPSLHLPVSRISSGIHSSRSSLSAKRSGWNWAAVEIGATRLPSPDG